LTCAKKKELLKSIRDNGFGSYVTKLNIKCDIHWREIQPGQRIIYAFSDFNGPEHDIILSYQTISGTVMKRMKKINKLLVWLDDNDFTRRKIVKLLPSLVEILNEPKEALCSMCNRPISKSNFEGFNCGLCNPAKEYIENCELDYEISKLSKLPDYFYDEMAKNMAKQIDEEIMKLFEKSKNRKE